jgi:putative salt-induced outer membrane protein
VLLFGADTAAEPTFETHTELSYINTSGNSDSSSFAFEFKGKKSYERYALRADAFANVSEDNGVESKNQWGIELNYDRTWTKSVSLNYLLGYKDDKFSGFDYQFYTGPGLVHKTIATDAHTLTSQANILYAEDKLESGDKEEYAAFKAGIDYTWKIQDNLKFKEVLNIRTDLSDLGNYFLYSKTSIQNKINSMLSMGVSYKVDYVNEPVAGKTSTDKTFLVSLIIDY